MPMKRPLLIVLLLVASFVLAQQDTQPRRTPEEVAQKQTERLQRDLELTQEQRDTIYRIHLKYALMRKPDEDREIVAQRIQKMKSELVDMLTPEQKDLFMVKMREYGPKRQSTPLMKAAEAEAVVVQTDTVR